MLRPLLPLSVAAMALGLGVSPPEAASVGLCKGAEQSLYRCTIKGKTVSVCKSGRELAVTYRYGRPGKVELEIVGRGGEETVHHGLVTGGGGGSQHSLRFTNGEHDYIVYSAVGGQYTEVPGKRWSGLVVLKGPGTVQEKKLVLDLPCPSTGKAQSLEGIPDWVAFEPPENDAWW